MVCMDKIIKHKNAYMKALEDSIEGNELSTLFPKVDSTSPYFAELNEEQEVASFAYELGSILKGKVGGSDNGDNNDGGTSTSHNHDDRYAKIVHNHDNRYYTKIEIDDWRDMLINGNLLFNKINANHIQAGTIVAGSSIIANGAIGSAQISKVSADKLDAGVIDTSRITIAGANGNLKLRGNRLQVFEGLGSSQFERVSLGDVNNDGTVYGLRVRGADGNTILYDENGVYREGITDGSITNDKIGNDANIDGGKLNIHSVITNINENNTGTIHGTKVDIDGESVTSKVYKIELNQNEHSESIERQQSEIDQNKEQIKLKVSNQKYTEDMGAMESRLDRTESEISVLNESIALTVTKTEVENQITEVKDFVADEIGELSVGGANYLNNSAPRKATVDEYVTWDRSLNGNHRLVYWQDYNDSVELPEIGYHPHIDLKTFHFPCIALINRNATFGMANRELSLRHEINKADEVIEPDETYVISFDAYSDTELFSFHGGLYHKVVESNKYDYHSGRMDVSVFTHNVGTWKRYSFSFITHKGINTSEPMYLVINGHNNPEGSGYIKNIKLEKGIIVSQWTPSQFDVDDSLDDVVNSMKEYTNSSVKELSTSIESNLDGITSKVSTLEKATTTINDTVSNHETRLSTAESKITDQAITNVVSKGFYTKEETENSITSKGYQTSSQVQQTVDKLEVKFKESGGYNLLRNSAFKNELKHWSAMRWDASAGGDHYVNVVKAGDYWTISNRNSINAYVTNLTGNSLGKPLCVGFDSDLFPVTEGCTYTLNCLLAVHRAYGVTIEMLCYNSNGDRLAGTNAIYISNIKTGGKDRNNWTPVKHTFTAQQGAVNCRLRLYLGEWTGESSHAHVWMAEPIVTEGSNSVAWTPSSDEMYTGITTIDKDGIQVQHNDNSFSRFNSNEMYQTNENGDRALSIRYGAYRMYQFNYNGNYASAYLGSMSSGRDSRDDVYGTTIFGSSSSGFIDLGFSESNADNQHTGISAWLRCVHYNGNGGLPFGTHSFKPFYMQDFSYYYARPRFYYGIAFPYDGRDDLNYEMSFIAQTSASSTSEGSRYLNIYGADGINIGVQNNGNYTGHKIIEDNSDARLHHESWGDWDFHWWRLRNTSISNTLSNPSSPIDSREHKYTRESHGIMSTKELIQDRGEDFTMDGSCIVEIPDDIKYSISRYDVNIIKYGRGDIWVSERTHDYFIVESENDIKFTWVLEGEVLDTFTTNSITPYNIEEKEDSSETKPKTREVFGTIPSSKYAIIGD